MPNIDTVRRGEGKTLEFKRSMPSGDSIAKTAVAFANTGGGCLLIGVEDTGEIVGINPDDRFVLQERIESIIYDSCSPMILPEIYTVRLENKLVLVVKIRRGSHMPYYLRSKGIENGTYLRFGISNRKADKFHIIDLERRSRNTTFDNEINSEYTLNESDYREIKHIFREIGKTPDDNTLLSLRLLKEESGKIYPTNGLLILLGKLPYARIQCSLFKGDTSDIFIDKREYSGNLISQSIETVNFVKRHINLRAEVKGLFRQEKYEIPIEALREVLLNAIIHRDYSITGRDIKVAIFDSTIKIISPGDLPNGLTVEEALEAGRSEARNTVLADIFRRLNLVEHWGGGLQSAITAATDAGLNPPVFSENGDSTLFQFIRPDSQTIQKIIQAESATDGSESATDGSESATDGSESATGGSESATGGSESATGGSYEDRIILVLKEKETIQNSDIRKLTGYSPSGVKNMLNKMIKAGLIERFGKGRATGYRLKNSNNTDKS